MNTFSQITKVYQKISTNFTNLVNIRPKMTIKEVSVNRCAWFWCVYTNDGPDRLLLRRLPMNVFSYLEAVDIAQAHIGLPREK